MRKIAVICMTILMALSLCACKGGYGSTMKSAKKALSSECGAKKADKDQYSMMVDSKYSSVDMMGTFDTGAYTEVKKGDYTFFRFHTVVDTSKVKSVFKYLKIDSGSYDEDMDSVALMEVLVIEFSDKNTAQSYFETLKASREKTYNNNKSLGTDMKNQFEDDDDYFAFASKTEFMTFNVYAKLDGKSVLYIREEGPSCPALEKEYQAFMDKMEYDYIKF